MILNQLDPYPERATGLIAKYHTTSSDSTAAILSGISLFVWPTGSEELSGSPPREDRIAAIKQTAAQLKQRLETEAWRLGLNLQPTSPRKPDEQLGTLKSTNDYAVFKGALPGM